MFTLAHFVFEIVKIAIQSAVYSLIILLLLIALAKVMGGDRLRRIKFKTIYYTVAGLLFIFSFTYYGDHGLGDEANIPLGHGKTMNSSDGYAFFYLNTHDQINVDRFLVRNEHLCFASKNDYYDYQLASGQYQKYNDQSEYEAYASVHNLPIVNEFETFEPQYASYWNGWRAWFLP